MARLPHLCEALRAGRQGTDAGLIPTKEKIVIDKIYFYIFGVNFVNETVDNLGKNS